VGDRIVVKDVRSYLRPLQDQGRIINFGVVFGSQVRDLPDSWGDLDLLVVSPRFDDLRNHADLGLLGTGNDGYADRGNSPKWQRGHPVSV
jgi:hypothetical protein